MKRSLLHYQAEATTSPAIIPQNTAPLSEADNSLFDLSLQDPAAKAAAIAIIQDQMRGYNGTAIGLKVIGSIGAGLAAVGVPVISAQIGPTTSLPIANTLLVLTVFALGQFAAKRADTCEKVAKIMCNELQQGLVIPREAIPAKNSYNCLHALAAPQPQT